MGLESPLGVNLGWVLVVERADLLTGSSLVGELEGPAPWSLASGSGACTVLASGAAPWEGRTQHGPPQGRRGSGTSPS